jgi:tetratricopeptide (TPR) repeat protein
MTTIGRWWQADRAYFKGCRLAREGEPLEAAKAFDRVLSMFPKHARAQGQRALALAQSGRVGEAVRAARRASELDPKNHAPLLFLGQIYYDSGNLEEARKAFSQALRLDPENRLVKAYLGLVFLAIGRTEDGSESLQSHLSYGYEGLEGRLLTLVEQRLWEQRDRARPLEDQLTVDEGGPDEAPAGLGLRLASALRLALLWPVARLRGRRALAMLLAAEAISVLDLERAVEHLQEAQRVGSRSTDIALALGNVYLELGRAQAAAEQLSHLPEEVRQQPDIALIVGAALFDCGRYEKARDYLTIAARRFTRDFAPAYYRGLCEIALGNPKVATQWFTEAAGRLNPHVARKRLEEMQRVMGEISDTETRR